MLTEVPIVVKNSYLMNALLMELQQQLPLELGGTQFLDLGTSGHLLFSLSLRRESGPQCFGPDSHGIRIRWVFWIRIRNADLDPGV
jgi:C-terminal region of eIF3h